MQDTHRTLMPAKQSATNGHVTLLKQKMVTAILRRLDCVLFDKLTAGTACLAHTHTAQGTISVVGGARDQGVGGGGWACLSFGREMLPVLSCIDAADGHEGYGYGGYWYLDTC